MSNWNSVRGRAISVALFAMVVARILAGTLHTHDHGGDEAANASTCHATNCHASTHHDEWEFAFKEQHRGDAGDCSLCDELLKLYPYRTEAREARSVTERGTFCTASLGTPRYVQVRWIPACPRPPPLQ